MKNSIEIVPAVLRKTFEGVAEDWEQVYQHVRHVQIDVTDGVFAGDGTFRDIARLKQLPHSEKIELHMMVQRPSEELPGIIDLAPARCVFHLEAFTGPEDIRDVYEQLRSSTPHTQLALAINPETPAERLGDYMDLLDYVLFMGYNPGFAGQPVDPTVFRKIAAFREQQPHIPLAADGQVNKETIPDYVRAGISILCANSSIFKEGDPVENIRQLELVAQGARV